MSQSVAQRKKEGLPLGKPSFFLTGASGYLGRAIALQHAAAGAHLHLWGRDSQRLQSTADAVEAKGATVQQTRLDLTDPVSAAQTIIAQDDEARFDVVYLIAGTGETRPTGALVEDPEVIARMAMVNYAAPAAMAAAVAARMADRGRGSIVLIGSAAAHHSLPFAASYSGSKAGLARFADALRLAVKPYGVSVTLAAPGFLDTPAHKKQNRPMELDVDEAARRIVRAGERGAARYVTPLPFRLLRVIDALLPARLRDAVLSKLGP